jgi:hypothetical protein
MTMTASQVKTALEKLGHEVETMHVSVGNIYRCQDLDGSNWMYEQAFITKAERLLGQA